MFYEQVIRRLLFRIPPESAHRSALYLGERLARSSAARRMFRAVYAVPGEALQIQALGLQFPNPVGLAAGFDKGGRLFPIFRDLGFGHVEIGSISLNPWPGNPPPVYLRLPKDYGLINRMGLNSEGAEAVLRRLGKARFEIPTGLNLVKTADPRIVGSDALQDYLGCFRRMHRCADFMTLNLSCPNTAEGKTFEEPAVLRALLQGLRGVRSEIETESGSKPVLLKISPDLDSGILHDILDLAAEYDISGLVVTNTTQHRETLRTSREVLDRFGFGGLSGYPLGPRVREMLGRIHGCSGKRFTLIACGGVGCDPEKSPAEETWEYLKLGATLVQLHTGLIYRGPGIARAIQTGLLRILKQEGFSSLTEYIALRDRNSLVSVPKIPGPS